MPVSTTINLDNGTQTFRTFNEINTYQISNIQNLEPYCSNGEVCVRQYEVTIKEIRVSESVIIERLQKLYDETRNMHVSDAVIKEAAKYGYAYNGSNLVKEDSL